MKRTVITVWVCVVISDCGRCCWVEVFPTEQQAKWFKSERQGIDGETIHVEEKEFEEVA